jgi:hypothetical protein
MREQKPIDQLMAVKVSSAESQGSVLDALAALLIDVHDKRKADDRPKENPNNKK